MRLVEVKQLKEGDIIGQDIISERGAMLLRRSSVFKEAYRANLLSKNIREIYLDDEVSRGIEPVQIISQHTRTRIYTDVVQEFDKIKTSLSVNCQVLSQVAGLLIEQLSSRNIVCEMTDLKTNHNDTYNHCIGVAIMATLVCRKMNLSDELIEKIVLGALMHDIGKMIIPKDILDKPAALTPEEYEIIKTHVTIGYEMIKNNVDLSPITKVSILCHHEREDGTGYPLGKGEDLHVGTKIIAACDVFHALLSDRSYRKGLPVNRAIMAAKGEKLDPKIREIVESILAFYPVGSVVGLNTGEFGIVEKNFTEDLERPLVRVIYKAHTGNIIPYKIDLRKQPDVYIIDKIEKIK